MPGADQYIDDYLTWAQTQRNCQVLVGAPPLAPDFEALGRLIELPVKLRWPSMVRLPEQASSRAYRRGLSSDQMDPQEDARRLMGLRDSIPRMLHLPEFLVPTCKAVVREIALTLPQGSLSPREQALFLGSPSQPFGPPSGREGSAVLRSLPPLPIGSQRFLNLQSVHPVCARFLVHLEDCFFMAHEELPSNLHPLAHGLLRRVQCDVLGRHYSEGLRAILARYVPELYSGCKKRLRLSAPLALVRFDAVPVVRMAFAPMSAYEDANDLSAAAGSR
ncbi:hypothetical protein XhyaCFBP1156_20800 [Xanthomonas hyacinthi]|uniref:Uncharacterized protein n=2 Tax=Xanthomonas hyacinthi TaxID=56455 RepID=A0A2S7ENM4_9XANT|nr:hypothetical protein Y886_14955 [Xanthomonas hyacinthi DSM 19077]PPU93208.1 hypothetical protein XhyaCFBP1156_20800 [Xanthomonas hyacinthi]